MLLLRFKNRTLSSFLDVNIFKNSNCNLGKNMSLKVKLAGLSRRSVGLLVGWLVCCLFFRSLVLS